MSGWDAVSGGQAILLHGDPHRTPINGRGRGKGGSFEPTKDFPPALAGS